MSYLTRIANYPDRDDIRAGMASFEGTGPAGKTCESCTHRGYWRTGKPRFNAQTGMLEETGRRSNSCAMFLKLTHRHGPTVEKEYRACKYYEPAVRRQ